MDCQFNVAWFHTWMLGSDCVYIYDIKEVGEEFDDTLTNLVEGRFCQHWLKLKPQNCELFPRLLTFLSRKVNQTGIHLTD